MSTTTTPNMGLTVPTAGSEPGPNWANEINSDLSALDQHNHTSGQGVKIPTAGININTDFPFNGYNATLLNSVRFTAVASPLAGVSPNLGCLYVSGNELYYNDEAGNQVKLTTNGSVNSGSGSITGLPSGTASASYAAGTFTWQSATSTAANMDFASAILRNATAGSFGYTLNPPNAMAANISATLPSANSTGSTAFLTYDTSNNFGVGPSTTGGITTSNLANQSITQAKLAPRSVGSTVGAGGVAISSSCGNYVSGSTSYNPITNLSVTLTTTGRPVWVGLISDDTSNEATISVSDSVAYTVHANFAIVNTSTTISVTGLQLTVGNSGTTNPYMGTLVPATAIQTVDTTVAGIAGTYTYSVSAKLINGTSFACSYAKLVAYEL